MLDCFGVLINLFCTSSSMGWTSLFDKFKLVSIFSSMCWTYRIFVRPWVGHVEYLLVHGLDVFKTLFSFIQGFYLVFYLDGFALSWRAYWRYISASKEFSRPWTWPFFSFLVNWLIWIKIWTKVTWKLGIHTTLCT